MTRIDAERSDARSLRHCVIASSHDRTTRMIRTRGSRFDRVPPRHFLVPMLPRGNASFSRSAWTARQARPPNLGEGSDAERTKRVFPRRAWEQGQTTRITHNLGSCLDRVAHRHCVTSGREPRKRAWAARYRSGTDALNSRESLQPISTRYRTFRRDDRPGCTACGE
jgi:hypothetical protein